MLEAKQLMFSSFVLFYDVLKIKEVKGLRNNSRQVKDNMVGTTVWQGVTGRVSRLALPHPTHAQSHSFELPVRGSWVFVMFPVKLDEGK